MSDPWEAEVFRVPDLSWQTQVPPARHPVPVQYATEVEPGDEVTIGLPGHYFIDGQVLALAERGVTTLAGQTEDQEALAVAAPFAYWLAKAFPKAGLTMQWWPVAYSWTYRDAVQPGKPPIDEGSATGDSARSWLDHVRSSLHEPPVRQPRPARAAASLSGRTVRLQHERGTWSWWIAVSEPIELDGNFVVHAMRPSDFWLTQVVFESVERVQVVPLYRLYVYD